MERVFISLRFVSDVHSNLSSSRQLQAAQSPRRAALARADSLQCHPNGFAAVTENSSVAAGHPGYNPSVNQPMKLTEEQREIIESATAGRVFLRGVAGTGKSTTGIGRLGHLLDSGVPGHSILILVPQRRLARPYLAELRNPRRPSGADVTIGTLGTLARRMVDLYWPLITDRLSRSFPSRRPKFLTLEMVQYLMFKILEPEIEQNDYFNSVTISRARLFSQIADNLNKSAVVGFPSTSIGERLKSAFPEEEERQHIFEDAQRCANLFRDYCRRYNLLDFSLQVELFCEGLWNFASPRQALVGRYRHLIVDNLEEDTPATHRLLRDWLPECESALLIYDEDAGYRRFLGADELTGLSLRAHCDRESVFTESRVMTRSMEALLGEVWRGIANEESAPTVTSSDARNRVRRVLAHTPVAQSRFHTQMLDWVAESVGGLVHRKKVAPEKIVILAPLMNDALRYSLVSRLTAQGVATRTLRPSRPLHDEPAVRALVVLAKLAHPEWPLIPRRRVSRAAVIRTLMTVLEGVDLTRASLMGHVLYQKGQLQPFSRITNAVMRSRISEVFGERYERLRVWLESRDDDTGGSEALDLFYRRLFGEVLSQPGFGFHLDHDAVRIIANLIDSARSFRQSIDRIDSRIDPGFEYIRMVDEGILADQYEQAEQRRETPAVLIAPAYTFLLGNRAVDYQFWINLDSPAWNRRLYQPLTQPYVLSAQWRSQDRWTEQHERETSREMLRRVLTGLLRRCRRKVFLGFSRYDERGFEQVGELRVLFDYILSRQALAVEVADGVDGRPEGGGE